MSHFHINNTDKRPRYLFDRRSFLKLSSAGALAGTFGTRLFGEEDSSVLYSRIVPQKKGLGAEWVRSLVSAEASLDAGIRADKPGGKLGQIGMTVGGIGCGTVYLSGDGQLYVWDIFNQHHEGVVAQQVTTPRGMENIADAGKMVRERDGANYVKPPNPSDFPNLFRQYFELSCDGVTRRMQDADWGQVEFDGTWPVGTVRYADSDFPVEVTLSAWTPFIPLDLEHSSLPVTVMEYELENLSDEAVEIGFSGVLENACFLHSRNSLPIEFTSKTSVIDVLTVLHHQAELKKPDIDAREDILFENFESGYGGWLTEGSAFGSGPVQQKDVPGYQGDLGMTGKAAVNSHASAPGRNVAEKDGATGTLTSPELEISRKFIRLKIGGGNHEGKTCVELLIADKVVRSITGHDANRMKPASIDVSEFMGREARLRIADRHEGGWGNIGADHIVFSDSPETPDDIGALEDAGTMAISVLGEQDVHSQDDERLTVKRVIPSKGSTKVIFLITWHFPNTHALPALGKRRRAYGNRFADASEVARFVAERFEALRGGTMAWRDVWYDSTLPRWLLDRCMVGTNTLQTQNCYIFDDGRFWAWEGIGCCPGTCGHVWHYAQGPARLFPEIERNLRLTTDFGISQKEDGGIPFRAEAAPTIAIDSQTTYVLRTWREHLCSVDDEFLKQAWAGAKKTIFWLFEFDRKDQDGLDGLLHGEQHNTLDAEWYGKVHALCSLYLASLRAAEEMAKLMGERKFARQCHEVFLSGSKKISELFNGEYFIQEEDPNHLKAIGVGTGCYIDQVIGQWWTNQVGLGRIYDAKQIRSALHSLWKYNFVPDVGPFRATMTRGRFYALPGDAGLVMCTWPKGGLRPGYQSHWQYAYFNECMTGFEWQAAAHMIQEGAVIEGSGLDKAIEDPTDPRSLTLRGLAVARAIHDRYSADKRNPYNEIECSDHYARAAASYSVFLAVSGFHYDGPAGVIGFEPKLQAENFRVAFTAAEGWGTFQQKNENGKWAAVLKLRHGRLKLSRIQLPWIDESTQITNQRSELSGSPKKGVLELEVPLILETGEHLVLSQAD